MSWAVWAVLRYADGLYYFLQPLSRRFERCAYACSIYCIRIVLRWPVLRGSSVRDFAAYTDGSCRISSYLRVISGTSPCPRDASNQLLRPSVTAVSRFISPTSHLYVVPSPSPPTTTSPVFNTIEAFARQLDPSAWPLELCCGFRQVSGYLSVAADPDQVRCEFGSGSKTSKFV